MAPAIGLLGMFSGWPLIAGAGPFCTHSGADSAADVTKQIASMAAARGMFMRRSVFLICSPAFWGSWHGEVNSVSDPKFGVLARRVLIVFGSI